MLTCAFSLRERLFGMKWADGSANHLLIHVLIEGVFDRLCRREGFVDQGIGILFISRGISTQETDGHPDDAPGRSPRGDRAPEEDPPAHVDNLIASIGVA